MTEKTYYFYTFFMQARNSFTQRMNIVVKTENFRKVELIIFEGALSAKATIFMNTTLMLIYSNHSA
ncbi:hypothetical protein EBO34_14590 [Alteribacter keqinensis]|uniref:Uncharacterized protein n=1 Tax=Alteribacter keqinensis TaxID=2483800 RepID=A0A3M7TR67_9BACI|nr:hypothetical protein EBO34_14590 [Alteribacter keqinensis]